MRGRDEIDSLLSAALARVTTGEAVATYTQSHVSATRFGENAITQNTSSVDEKVVISVRIGRRQGSASTSRIDTASIDALVRNASEIARLSPEDPECMPLPGPQIYGRPPLARSDEGHDALRAADGVARVVDRAKAHCYVASGVFQTTSVVSGIANTSGLFGFDEASVSDWSTTVHGPNGSGKATQNHNAPARIDPEALAAEAVSGAVNAQDPIEVAPGDYDVVLAPTAVAQLVEYLGYQMSARDADEGSTAFAGTFGTKLVSEKVTLRLAVDDPDLPAPMWGSDGLAVTGRTWIGRGVVERLSHDRFWAHKRSQEPDPALFPFTMDGGEAEIEDLVRDCRKGLLVKNLWYIRFVDPRTLTLTGITRDGVFCIENGRVTAPVKNLRWNESPIDVLKNLTGLTRASRVVGARMPAKVPAIASAGFTFTSTTDSV